MFFNTLGVKITGAEKAGNTAKIVRLFSIIVLMTTIMLLTYAILNKIHLIFFKIQDLTDVLIVG